LAVDARLRALDRGSEANFSGTNANGRPIFVRQPTNQYTSQYTGVSYRKDTCKWGARITVPGEKQQCLGKAFETEVVAARAYDEVARPHGMPTNF
jgi:hypothetical protein